MRRRDFVTLVGSAAAWPFASSAQQAVPVVGYLSGRSVNSEAPLRTPFLKALESAGFIVGQNVVIDYRFSEGRDERFPVLAAERQRQIRSRSYSTVAMIQSVTAWFKASIALAAMQQASAC